MAFTKMVRRSSWLRSAICSPCRKEVWWWRLLQLSFQPLSSCVNRAFQLGFWPGPTAATNPTWHAETAAAATSTWRSSERSAMTWIDLADPLPRSAPEPYTPIEWELGETRSLPSTSGVPDRSFNEVIDARASHREFGFVDDQQLGAFLWLACRTRGVGASELGFDLEHRAAPSAGAIHPIHVVVKRPGDDRWWLYVPRSHRLEIGRAHV